MIDSIDHFVLTVQSVEASVEFYSTVLNMKVTTFSGDRKSLHFGKQKINLHQAGEELAPHATEPVPGSQDFCLISSTPLDEIIEHVKSCGVQIIEGPGNRTGAIGEIHSIYFRDPDGNLVEIANYIHT